MWDSFSGKIIKLKPNSDTFYLKFFEEAIPELDLSEV